jgi:hypothetical protein
VKSYRRFHLKAINCDILVWPLRNFRKALHMVP